ncbi:hypothetical protein PAXRUDRAFT_157748, partial [Paxillus rubicundulus Ve08.2h10]
HVSHKCNHSFQANEIMNPGELLPTCTVCLGINPHSMPVVECPAKKTWDNKHKTFSKCSNRTLIAKAMGQRICTH